MDPTDLAVLFSNLVGLFLLIGVGFLAVRLRLLPAEASKPLSALLMKITLPATVFSSMLRPYDPNFFGNGIAILLVSTALFLLFGLLSAPLARLLKVPEGQRGIWRCCTTFCNNGFMGFPVAYALFGDEGLMLAVIIGIPFNFFLYSWGIRMVCGDRVQSEPRQRTSLVAALVTPINIAMLLSLIFYITQIPVPSPILTPIKHLSNVTTPLSMLVTGMNLGQGIISDVVRDRNAITASAVRLLLFPLIARALLLLLPGLDPLVLGVTLVIFAMPAPATAPILGEQYGGCTRLAARVVFLSSLLCIVTIPLVSLLL